MLRTRISPRRRSAGVVLILALLMLVVMTLAAIALTRSVSTSNAIAGNLAFQQAATTSANIGTEAAIVWLENNTGQTVGTATATTCPVGGPVPETTVLACDQNTVTSGSHQGYIAHRQDPASGVSWMDFWNSSLGQFAVSLPVDAAGNTVSYVVQRLCSGVGDPGSPNLQCTATPVLVGGGAGSCAATGSNCNSGSANLNSVASQVYYRITVQVAGPRNTQSMTQTVVAM
jgi:type IV pilus assembly protein PilX